MNFYELFLKPYASYETYQIVLETIAMTFGILSVYFSIKKNIWVYPTGIISTVLYVYILFVFGLLGDMMINFYYSVMSIYGWILWSKHSEDHVHVEVSWATKKEWIFATILFILSLNLVTMVYYYKPFIDNHFSMINVELGLYHLDWANWLDILTTAIFLVGMWLMAKRRIENWIFWIIGDIICIPMMIYKGLGITSIQFLVFTVMAIIGYFEWKKDRLINNSN
ncbi:nicotinamide riboside transporter PnuC [Kaistella yonginensis]|uniref:nicotinamide riboside transporter PnuC n=1 Tax=Kaistella yonginensis TaxID=658267 RepID=UPI0025B5D3B3|nr:nicotinamide riboside transporter PnuC [Kaistella yonginensis]MDN3606239.1 nicotinamide riboside transporter PnuC [Kaistella yonginensis]